MTMNRQKVFDRDNNQCVFCGSRKDLTVDHILPKSKGGKSNSENLQTLCGPCNSRKSSYFKGEVQESTEVLKKDKKKFRPLCTHDCHSGKNGWPISAYCWDCHENHSAVYAK